MLSSFPTILLVLQFCELIAIGFPCFVDLVTMKRKCCAIATSRVSRSRKLNPSEKLLNLLCNV